MGVLETVPNQLSSDLMEFKKTVNTTPGYAYDANGNLTKDLYKNISLIQYNSINLSKRMNVNGSVIYYIHDFHGNKVQVIHETGTSPYNSINTVYGENVIYENGIPVKALTEEGFIYVGSDRYYYLQDHQGSNRVVLNGESGSVEEFTNHYPFGVSFAEQTSSLSYMNIQPYKYTGKELDRMYGINLYDYGARMYDPTIGRFTTMDPLAEINYSVSPYAYCGNNPVNRIDPTGMDWVEDKDGNAIWRAEYTKDNLPEGYKYIGTEYTIGNTKFTQKSNDKGEVSLYASVVENKKPDQTSTQNATFAPAIPWYATAGEIIGTSALRMAGGILSLIFLTGDTDTHGENLVSIDAYYPPPKVLPGFPGAERVPSKGNRARWRLPEGKPGRKTEK